MTNILYILSSYLKHNNYYLGRKLKTYLLSDSNNSILAVSNTLEHFNIENTIINIPKDSFNKLPDSFIAHIKDDNFDDLVLVYKIKDNKLKVTENRFINKIINKESFIEKWSGLVIVVEYNKLKYSALKIKFKHNFQHLSITFFIILIFLYNKIYSKIDLLFLFHSLSFAGLITTLFILKEKLHVDYVSSKFCSLHKKINCQAVLKSEGANILKVISLDELSILYFFGLSTLSIFNIEDIWLKPLSLLALPITLFSIYYQYHKIKRWCSFCIIIILIVWTQFFITFYINTPFTFSLSDFLLFLLIYLGIIILLVFLKPLYEKIKIFNNLMIENLSFRKNPKLFLPLYKEQNKVEDYIKDNTSKIIVGKPDSKIKLTLIVNLSCIYCIKINKIIYKLLKKYPQDLSIQFIFLTQKNDKKQIPYIKYLLYLYLNKGSEKFLKEYNNWFNKTKLRIQLKNHNNDLVYDTIIDNHRDWCVENEILTTPSILINRKRFPSFYHPNDIENFIGVVLDYEKNKSKL